MKREYSRREGVKIKYIWFETEEDLNVIHFDIDLLGNITNIGYGRGKKGELGVGEEKIKIISTNPNCFREFIGIIDIKFRKFKKFIIECGHHTKKEE